MGRDMETCRRFRDWERRGHNSRGDKANQPSEFLGKWPLATSPTGPGVAGEDLGVPSNYLSQRF